MSAFVQVNRERKCLLCTADIGNRPLWRSLIDKEGDPQPGVHGAICAVHGAVCCALRRCRTRGSGATGRYSGCPLFLQVNRERSVCFALQAEILPVGLSMAKRNLLQACSISVHSGQPARAFRGALSLRKGCVAEIKKAGVLRPLLLGDASRSVRNCRRCQHSPWSACICWCLWCLARRYCQNLHTARANPPPATG